MSQFTETTQVGFFARLKNGIKGIGLGISLVGIAVYFLFWNEGNAVRTARALAEGAGQVVSVDSAALDSSHEGQLVHINGPLTLAAPLADVALGVVASAQTVRLERKVEQFAWIEDKQTTTDTKLGGSQEKTTQYTYHLDWTDAPASGAEFRIPDGHVNPPMPVSSKVIRQPEGAIGAFTVNDEISDLGGATPVLLNAKHAQAVARALSLEQPAKLVAGRIVLGADVTAPQLGDIRVSYQASTIDEASVVGVQRGDTLVPYTAQNGRKIYLVEEGLRTAEEMFQTAVASNTFKTWMLRIGLMVLLFLGFKALFGVVDVIASVLPFLGWITASVTSLISFALTLVVGGTTMAIAWVYFRPVLALVIISVALAGAAASAYWLRKSAPAATQTT
ncbi:TMEM43 family protein [Pseudophaeobacter sp.]|uniref:TMEM43 family protein n=1 Tax=Pseudophaeobacter sp. TaxID=1971739 RepID=UPI003A983841